MNKDIDMVITTAADSKYFSQLMCLIGSLHKSNFDSLTQIYVYNLGLSDSERSAINNLQKVTLREVEKTNPDIIRQMQKHPGSNLVSIPGCYSWKPVIIKQTLDEYDAVFWMDAGVTVLKSLQPIFEHVKITGYFFMGTSELGIWLNKYPMEKLNVTKVELATLGINAGMQCLNHKYFDTYVLPVYECSKDIKMFVDDGTAVQGPFGGRHDQSLFNIFAARNNMKPFYGPNVTLATGQKVCLAGDRSQINNDTIIYHCRGDGQDNAKFIRKKR